MILNENENEIKMSSFAYGLMVMLSLKTKLYNAQFRVFCSTHIKITIFSVSIDLCQL